jgi:ribonuclease HII
MIRGLDDSKKLNEATREKLYDRIVERAEAWAVSWCEPEEIDSINILRASLLAMEKALAQITSDWTLALVDGNQYMPRVSMEKQLPVVKGDGQSASIAAASIVAKVTRDRMMVEYHGVYPQYGFDRHKGYATAYHRECIERYGLCEIHRRSFCRTDAAQTTLPLDFGTA